MGSDFEILGGVRSDEKINPRDIVRTKKALAKLGYYRSQNDVDAEFTDGDLFWAIESFQAEHNLNRDGIMLPGGETERAIDEALRRKRSKDEDALARYRFLPQIRDPVGQGTEREDSAGAGFYQAPRNGGRRPHKGLDLDAPKGAPVVAPIDGVIELRGYAYKEEERIKDPRLNELQSAFIRGIGEFKGMTALLLYVTADDWPPIGSRVKAGTTIIGSAQNVGKVRENDSIDPHVHLELNWQGNGIDPSRVIPEWRRPWQPIREVKDLDHE